LTTHSFTHDFFPLPPSLDNTPPLPCSWISLARAYLGALIFSGFLVYDTQLIAGGGRRYQLRPSQHIMGALMIFSDVLNLFITVLQAMARSDRD
jgi:hypothetical protein